MSTSNATLAKFVYQNLTARDALAVMTIAAADLPSARTVGEACGRKHSWLGQRLPHINEKLALIDLEIGVSASGRGYELRDVTPEPEPAPASEQLETLADNFEQALAVHEPTEQPPPAKPKIHAHFLEIGGKLIDARRFIAVDPNNMKQHVKVTMQGGGFVFIPCPNTDPYSIAAKIIESKKREEGVKVETISLGDD